MALAAIVSNMFELCQVTDVVHVYIWTGVTCMADLSTNISAHT